MAFALSIAMVISPDVMAEPVVVEDDALAFSQVNFAFADAYAPALLDSAWGRLEVDHAELAVATPLTSGFLNVYTDAGWVVQNLWVDVTDPFESITTYFDLAVSSGTDVTQLFAYVDFSVDPTLDFQDAPRGNPFPVAPYQYAAQGGPQLALSYGDPPKPKQAKMAPQAAVQEVSQPSEPNVQAAFAQCASMSVANSLQYLEDKFAIPIPHDHKKGVKGDNTLVGKLDTAMMRFAPQRAMFPPGGAPVLGQIPMGMRPDEMLTGKFKYLTDPQTDPQNKLKHRLDHSHQGTRDSPNYGLVPKDFKKHGITSKDMSGKRKNGQGLEITGVVTFEWIFDRIAEGADVELTHSIKKNGILGSHNVRVFECGTTKGQQWIGFLHDALQTIPPMLQAQNGTKYYKGDGRYPVVPGFNPPIVVGMEGDPDDTKGLERVRLNVGDTDKNGVLNLGTEGWEIIFVLAEKPTVQGACCPSPLGPCFVAYEPECKEMGGRFRGANTICEGDPDADGVIGACEDTCPLVPNPDQLDTDGDGFGDACDPCPFDAHDDSDFDGVCDSADRCFGYDDRMDEDLDGVPDCPETIPTVSDWGLLILTLLLLTAGKVYFGSRKPLTSYE